MRNDLGRRFVVSEQGLDDPDRQFYKNYVCGALRNYSGYCNPELEKLFDRQSMEPEEGTRRPIILYSRGGTRRQPHVKGLTLMVNSIFNGWRMEDVWLDK
jgi:peptide/nickel transport system substrate-binding protein